MDSFFARNRLSAYVDGLLPPEEAAEVAAAIERDPELRREHEALKRTLELLRKEGPARAPAGFHARMMDRVRDEAMPGGPAWRLRQLWRQVPMEGVALLAAAAVVAIAVFGGRTDPAGSPEASAPVAAAQEATSRSPAREPVLAEGSTAAAVGVERPEPSVGDTGLTPPPPEGAEPPPRSVMTITHSDGSPTAAADLVPGSEMSGPWVWRLEADNPDILRIVDQAAQSFGGRVLSRGGSPAAPRALTTEDNFVQVRLEVPVDQAIAARQWLRAGGARPGEGGAAPSPEAQTVGYTIEITYRP